MPERDFWLALCGVSGIGARRLDRLITTFGSAQGAWEASAEDLEGCGLPAPVLSRLLEARRGSDPEEAAGRLARLGLSGVTLLDLDYPPALRSVPGCPPALFVRGNVACLSLASVAVVGTRRPTHGGLEVTAEIAGDLAASGLAVVSGLALGVDAAAHRAALDAGGVTVAVLGSGHNHLYPGSNTGLARRIVAGGGAVISQFDPAALPERAKFVVRNRVVAGLALGVVVTEAPAGSGALKTARFGRALCRTIMAVPGPGSSPTFAGCVELLREGARAVTSAAHVLSDLALPGPARSMPADPGGVRAIRAGWSGEACPVSVPLDGPVSQATAVLACLDPGEVVPFDRLISRTGLSVENLSAALGLLEIKGLVSRQAGQNYLRI